MKRQVLSIEQMKELQGLGIDSSNASAMWTSIVDKDYNPIRWLPMLRNDSTTIDVIREEFPLTYKEGNVYYALTLYGILDLLPKEIDDVEFDNECGKYKLELTYVNGLPQISYTRRRDGETTHLSVFCSDELDAAFKMLKWCKENKHI